MSWRDAPLHVEATSLCQDVLTRSSSWAGPGAAPLAAPCAEAALALGEAVALALTFPEGRAALGRLNGLLLLGGADPAGLVLAWLTELEGAVLPAVVGFARWADQPPPARR